MDESVWYADNFILTDTWKRKVIRHGKYNLFVIAWSVFVHQRVFSFESIKQASFSEQRVKCRRIESNSKMALADICNFDSFMKPNSTTTSALYEDMVTNQCSNLQNNYQLAMPPFENVSLND